MTQQARRIVMTLALAFVSGGLVSSLLAWLVVPARLSVEYLTPITVSGPFVGLLVGGVIARVGRTIPEPSVPFAITLTQHVKSFTRLPPDESLVAAATGRHLLNYPDVAGFPTYARQALSLLT